MLLFLIFTASVQPVLGQAQETFTSNGTFTVPPGVTEITVQAWGAGGGGGGRGSSGTARGGGGGAFAASTLQVTPGAQLTVTIGSGGSGGTGNNNGSAGGNSLINDGFTNLVLAAGGAGGSTSTSGSGGAGGTVASSIGQTRHAGGSGEAGGGGGAGTTGAGGNASGSTGGSGTTEGGGNGGNAPIPRSLWANINGASGSVYGGAGSGGSVGLLGSSANGGTGADGRIIVSWSPPSAGNSTISANPAVGVIADGVDASTLTITVRNEDDEVMGEDVEVFFAITSGTGSLSSGTWLTASNGQASASLTTTTPGIITVTGYLGDDNTGDAIGTADVLAGSVLFEIAFSGEKGWRMLAFPLQNTTYGDIFDTAQNSGLVTQGFTGSTWPNEAPNLVWYDETGTGTDLQRWRQPGSLGENVVTGRGYLYYVFGNIEEDSRFDALPAVQDISISLQAFEQSETTVDFGATYTAAADSGWNLLGNPFANDLNWDAITGWTRSDNISGELHIWDPSMNWDPVRQVNDGGYRVWNRLTQTGSLGNGLIASGQAFWVKVMDDEESPELKVTPDALSPGATFYGKIAGDPEESDRQAVAPDADHTGETEAGSLAIAAEQGQRQTETRPENRPGHSYGKRPAPDTDAAVSAAQIELSRPTIELVLSKDHFQHSTYIAFREGASMGVDAMDAWHLQPLSDTYVTLATIANGKKLAINTLPRRFNAPLEIPVAIAGYREGENMSGTFELSLGQFRDIPDSWAIELVEKKTNTRIYWKRAGESVLHTHDEGRLSLNRNYYPDSRSAVMSLQATDHDRLQSGTTGSRPAGDHSGAVSGSSPAGSAGGTNSGYTASSQTVASGPQAGEASGQRNYPRALRKAPFDFEYSPEVKRTIQAPGPGEPIPMKALPGTMESRFVLKIYPNGEFPELPERVTLWQNYPNPFNPATTIRFGLPVEKDVRVDIFDILGRRVATLAQDTYPSGTHEVIFDGTRYASGVYIIRLMAGSSVETRKMTLIK